MNGVHAEGVQAETTTGWSNETWTYRHLCEHGIVVGSDDSASETVSTIQTDTVATSTAVDLNAAGVRLEALGRVLGGDTALDGEPPGGDAVLGEAELGEGGAGGDLDLGGDDVDARDLLGDGVLDLDAGVDLDEVVPVLLVDEELRGAGVAVADRLCEADGVVEHGVADLGGKVLGRGDLDDLLVPPLDGAVTLVQVHDVAMVVTEELHLDVLGLVEEALDEDGAVAEGGLCLGRGALEVLLQRFLVADHTHATATASVGGLDDDGEAILVGEALDLLKLLHCALCSGDDGHVCLDGDLSGRDLVSEGVDDLGRRSDELFSDARDQLGANCREGEK